MKKLKIEQAFTQGSLDKIYDLYMEAFPKEERKPFEMMLQKQSEGSMALYAITDDRDVFLGLAIFVFGRDMALLDYFAIEPHLRSTGIGTTALKQLQQMFPEKRFFLEIESTYQQCRDAANRARRKAFYLQNGMMPQGYLVHLFGVEMEILTYQCQVTYEEYYSVYEGICTPAMLHNVQFLRNLEQTSEAWKEQ